MSPLHTALFGHRLVEALLVRRPSYRSTCMSTCQQMSASLRVRLPNCQNASLPPPVWRSSYKHLLSGEL